MSQSADDFVPVRRDVLANLQSSAALGERMRGYGGRARDVVVAEAKALPSTATSIVQPIGVGAIIAYVATMDDVKNSETIKSRWWLLPVALLVVGYILRRKESKHASAILTAGAVLFVQAYRNRPKEETKTTTKASDTAGPTFAAPPTMHPIDDRTAWIQSGGQWVRVQLAAPVRSALPMQTASGAQVNDPAAALAAAAFAA
jgi:hypothetical protein